MYKNVYNLLYKAVQESVDEVTHHSSPHPKTIHPHVRNLKNGRKSSLNTFENESRLASGVPCF
jgi:hypothetical protein